MINSKDIPYADFNKVMLAKLDELKAIFQEKNIQYSNNTSPLANFATGAILSSGKDTLAAMYEEAKAYQRKHIAFISGHDITAPKAGESLKDIAIYSLIQLYMWEKAREERKSE